jgi:hypothetical protein
VKYILKPKILQRRSNPKSLHVPHKNANCCTCTLNYTIRYAYPGIIMDPITLGLIGLGLVGLVTIVTYFLVAENAENYKKEVESSTKKIEKLEQELKTEKQIRERQNKEINDVLRAEEKLKERKELLSNETSIISSILTIVVNGFTGNIVDIPGNLLKLVENFRMSFILRKHFRDPENARDALRKDTDGFIRNIKEDLRF